MSDTEVKFVAKYVIVPIVSLLLLYHAVDGLWSNFGIWLIIAPLAFALIAFLLYVRSTKRPEHPWD